jgi:hypothetical protein
MVSCRLADSSGRIVKEVTIYVQDSQWLISYEDKGGIIQNLYTRSPNCPPNARCVADWATLEKLYPSSSANFSPMV